MSYRELLQNQMPFKQAGEILLLMLGVNHSHQTRRLTWKTTLITLIFLTSYMTMRKRKTDKEFKWNFFRRSKITKMVLNLKKISVISVSKTYSKNCTSIKFNLRIYKIRMSLFKTWAIHLQILMGNCPLIFNNRDLPVLILNLLLKRKLSIGESTIQLWKVWEMLIQRMVGPLKTINHGPWISPITKLLIKIRQLLEETPWLVAIQTFIWKINELMQVEINGLKPKDMNQ